MTAQRLYMAVHVRNDVELEDWELEPIGPAADPAGWAELCQEKWGEYKPFFWPKTGVPYRSRSTAQKRVNIINRWGGNAVVMECTPVWQTVADANAERERRRVYDRIMRLEDQLAEQRRKLAGVRRES